MCSIHLLKLISIFFRKRAFHKKYFIPLWRTIKPDIIYEKEGRRFLYLRICVGNPRRAKRNRILRAVRKRVYRWDWDGPDIMKAFTSANVQQTLWNVRNFRSYAASNLATVDAPGCDYFVLRKNPSVLYICQLRMFFMRRRWRVYVVEGEYVQNVWYIISAWAILLFVQQYRALLTASECGSDNGRFTLFLCPWVAGIVRTSRKIMEIGWGKVSVRPVCCQLGHLQNLIKQGGIGQRTGWNQTAFKRKTLYLH